MELSKRDKWEIWMQDLDERLAYHLYELKERKKLTDGMATVEVRESEQNKGTWEVWEGGRKRFVYDCPLAHYRATKKAAEILEELQSENSTKRLGR